MGLLLFKECYWDAIVRGQKRTTIRRWAHARLRAGTRAFAGPGVGWVMVDAVDEIALTALTAADARADGFSSLNAMRRALRAHYPNAPRRQAVVPDRVPGPRAGERVRAAAGMNATAKAAKSAKGSRRCELRKGEGVG